MQCPVCDEKMREIEKFGVLIDICPGCKGVWLDRGELEKILEMEGRGELPAGAQPSELPGPARRPEIAVDPRMAEERHRERHSDRHDDHDRHEHHEDERYRYRDHDDHDHDRDRRHGGFFGGYGKHHKRGGLLGEIFGAFGGDD